MNPANDVGGQPPEPLLKKLDESGIEVLSPPADHDFEAQWYDITWQNHFLLEWRLRALLFLVSGLGVDLGKQAEVMDVGGGHGVLRDQMEARSGWRIDLTDIEPSGLLMCKPGRGSTLCYNVLQRDKKFRQKHDYIMLFDVLEHIEHTTEFLDAVLFHLKPNGKLLINVPANPAFYSTFDSTVGHLRRYDKQSLRHEFSGMPARVEETLYWGLCLMPALVARGVIMRNHSHNKASKKKILNDGLSVRSDALNKLFRGIMKLETALPLKMPIGISVMCSVVKK